MANPTLLTSPIAENGDKNVIPASTGATTGLLDQEHGFQQINELPLQAGGLPPQRKDFNGIFNLLSGIDYMTQRGYTFEWDATLPYVVGCIVRDTDGKLYRCINDVNAGGTQPSLDTTNWINWDLSSYYPITGGELAGNIICRNVINDGLTIFGGKTYYTGGYLDLRGTRAAVNPGGFMLNAYDANGDGVIYLRGTREKKLTWGTNVNYVDIGSASIKAMSLGASRNYIRFGDGRLWQWGQDSITGSSGTVTLPLTIGGSGAVCFISKTNNNDSSSVLDVAIPHNTELAIHQSGTGKTYFHWLVISAS